MNTGGAEKVEYMYFTRASHEWSHKKSIGKITKLEQILSLCMLLVHRWAKNTISNLWP